MYDYTDVLDALNSRTPHAFSLVNTGGGCMCLIAENVSVGTGHSFDICIGGHDGPLPHREDLDTHGRFGVELVERGHGDGPHGYYTETRHLTATGTDIAELVNAVNTCPTSATTHVPHITWTRTDLALYGVVSKAAAREVLDTDFDPDLDADQALYLTSEDGDGIAIAGTREQLADLAATIQRHLTATHQEQ